MITKLLDMLMGKLASHLVDYLDVAARNIFASIVKEYELSRVAKIEKEMIRIEAELNAKPRITEDEAMDYARRINESRRKL